MRSFIKNKTVQIVFTLIGALGGFLYWKFVGCESGTCAIKSVWYWSTLWGAVLGYLVSDLGVDIVKKFKNRKNKNDERKV